jgi:hypothetical protein
VRSAADVTADMSGSAGFSANSAARAKMNIRDRGNRMKNGTKGQAGKAVSLPLVAFALSLAFAGSAGAQENGNPSSAPSSRPLDFRLPPADDGRTPGVQGPSDNGLPPIAPGERLGPQPAPTPAPTPPRVTPTQPATTTPATQVRAPRREAPAPAAPRPASGTADSAQPVVPDTPVLPPLQPGASNIATPTAAPASAAAPAADDVPAAAAPASAGTGTPLWAWLLAALVAVGAGFWYWRRRTALAGPAADKVEEAPRSPPLPAPHAAAPSAKPAAPASAPVRPVLRDEPRPASPLVTRASGEQRARVGMALDVRSIRFAPDHVAVGFTLHLTNEGTLPATGLLVRIALNQGSAMPEPVLGRFFDGAGGSVLRDDMMLGVGAGEELSTEVMLPRAAIEPLMIGGKPMLVPVMAFDVTYHWDGEGEAFGQNAGSFVLGRAAAPGAGDKLAPLALDRASYNVDRPAARSTAIRRSQ